MNHVFSVAVDLKLNEDFGDGFDRRTQELLVYACRVYRAQRPEREKDRVLFRTSDYKLALVLRDELRKKDDAFSIAEISPWDGLGIAHARYVPLTVNVGGF